ncbi:MAF protein [human gut metagenome]|uniref:MAF protein n=1 Tax=human gut metagenome TaxID=408170 RepID=K1T6N9_9ZZZZ
MLLHEKLKNYRLLLASQSPRRRELIAGCGLPYELAPRFECEERYQTNFRPKRCRSTSHSSRAGPTPNPSASGTSC